MQDDDHLDTALSDDADLSLEEVSPGRPGPGPPATQS